MDLSTQQIPLVQNPRIRCSHAAQVDPKMLRPNPSNPNRHPPKQIEAFINIITYTGWRRPITVSRQSNYVTKGHGALESALAAGWTIVPVDYQDYDDEAQELADIAADNFLQQMSEMDNVALSTMLLKLDENPDFNLTLTGMELPKIEQMMIDIPEWNARRTSAADDLSLSDYHDSAPPPNGPPEPSYASDSAPSGGPAEGQPHHEPSSSESPSCAPSSHVRMIQLFFNEETVAEFMTLVEFFQKQMNIDNMTDAVLEALRRGKNMEAPA